MLQLARRIYNPLDDIKAEADHKTYVLVAHNGFHVWYSRIFYICPMKTMRYLG